MHHLLKIYSRYSNSDICTIVADIVVWYFCTTWPTGVSINEPGTPQVLGNIDMKLGAEFQELGRLARHCGRESIAMNSSFLSVALD